MMLMEPKRSRNDGGVAGKGGRTLSRRDWMQRTAWAAAAAAAALGAPDPRLEARAGRQFCFFSKHLAELEWGDLGRTVRAVGFDGVDLTVRPAGHVLPERAAEDLPRAVEAITSHGLAVPMITTELTSPDAPTARPILQAASRAGVRFFKTGYWRYTASPDVRGQLAKVADQLEGLTTLAREYGIELGFHNHTAYVGAALWDIAPAMDRLDPRWAGYYFDPRHAVAEGGGGAWKAATHMVAPRLKMVALKDFYWNRTEKGWRIQDCPLGEGMVDWEWTAQALRAAQFAGPISLHFEYEIPGATPTERTRHTVEAARRDLAFARRHLAS
jgi:sugar phosphate isomerase/epimerase